MVGDHLFTVCFAGGAEELQQQLSAAPTTPSFDREISSAVTAFINQELKHYYLLLQNNSLHKQHRLFSSLLCKNSLSSDYLDHLNFNRTFY